MPHQNRARFGGANLNADLQNAIENSNCNLTYCCVPTGCLERERAINKDDMSAVVKVICNNEVCNLGNCMHRDCFDEWEQTVLTYLKSTGRARSWSEKQRLQNLWTKKGYDLAYKACSCNCSKGHLRKDLDWIPPKPKDDTLNQKKKKNRKKKNDKPSLNMPIPNKDVGRCSASTPSTTAAAAPLVVAQGISVAYRNRASSLSSTSCSSSPPISGSLDSAIGSPSPLIHVNDGTNKKCKFEYQLSSSSSSSCSVHLDNDDEASRERRDSGGSLGSGLGKSYIHAPNKFSRRQDFSSFSTLPRHKINSYHIKTEDDSSNGSDETRNLVLSSIGACSKSGKVCCILCHSTMNIFERYPLIDGTFFLSPRQHSRNSCIQVPLGVGEDGRQRMQYLNAVCMACLEGWTNASSLRCRYCNSRWDGSSLILGTMYSYDIFAAIPCCPERLKCNNCHSMILRPDQRLQYFSDYSRSVPCPRCAVIDFHFIKSLSTYNRRSQSLT